MTTHSTLSAAFCLFDTSTAVLSAVMFALSCGYFRTSLPPVHMLFGWLIALALLSHTGRPSIRIFAQFAEDYTQADILCPSQDLSTHSYTLFGT